MYTIAGTLFLNHQQNGIYIDNLILEAIGWGYYHIIIHVHLINADNNLPVLSVR